MVRAGVRVGFAYICLPQACKLFALVGLINQLFLVALCYDLKPNITKHLILKNVDSLSIFDALAVFQLI